MAVRAVEDEDPYFTRRRNLDVSQQLTLGLPGKPKMTVGHFRRDQPGLGITNPSIVGESVMAVVHLRARPGDDIWGDGRHLTTTDAEVGSFVLFDQRRTWVSNLRQPFDTVNFFVPMSCFDGLADEMRTHRAEPQPRDLTEKRIDDVMLNLARAVLPALANPHEMNQLYAEHIFAAVRVHLALNYGGVAPGAPRERGGLAGWQVSRAKDMLRDNLQADVGLTELAAACGLSPSHFARGFKLATGLPPHRWLLAERVALARRLMETTALSLAEIALECGFADQSHLTRVFSRAMGSTPGAWRRMRLH